MARLWLRATGEDGRQHVLYNPERERHQLTARCPCVPRVERAVVIHATYTPRGKMPSAKTEKLELIDGISTV